MKNRSTKFVCCGMVLLALTPPIAFAQPAAAPADTATSAAPPATQPDKQLLKPEELEQLIAPVALYPDSLLTQVFMASTYPLEVVQADRWQKANKDLTGDALATELEKQDWDPSVRSLVNFPDVLSMMSEKLDLTIKLGDAFIEQQSDVMNTVQVLRGKAQAAGNLKSNEQQTITVAAPPAPEPTPVAAPQTVIIQQVAPPPQIITIVSPSPTVIYVPTYNPVVVYGAWPYPAYPPYPYYPPRPPHYVASAAVWFGVGVACGAAWGYAWGNCNWGHSNVNININQNVRFNGNINRNNFNNNINIQGGNRTNIQGGNRTNIQGGNTTWQHDPSHRKGVAYSDQATAQRFGNANQSAQAEKARDEYRGRAAAGQQDLARGSADQYKGKSARDRSAPDRSGANVPDRSGTAGQDRTGAAGGQNRSNSAGQDRAGAGAQNRAGNTGERSGGASRGSAFDGAGDSGSAARSASQRGQSSRGGGGATRGGGRGGGRR